MAVRGLLLDFYGTVVEDDDAAVAAIAARVAAGAAVAVTAREVTDAWMREFTAVAEGPPFCPLRPSAVRSLAAVMRHVGCAGDATAWYGEQHAPGRVPPLRPGSREFLAGVAVPVCVVSDVDSADLAAAVARHGLSFAATVTSQEVGAYKPARRMFARALELLGLRADEALHVGDSLATDVAGARAAGIRPVWVNRHGAAVPAGLDAIVRLDELRGRVPWRPPGP